jgi:hypothetical protein
VSNEVAIASSTASVPGEAEIDRLEQVRLTGPVGAVNYRDPLAELYRRRREVAKPENLDPLNQQRRLTR